MLLVELLLLLRAPLALHLALSMRRAGDFVLPLAAERAVVAAFTFAVWSRWEFAGSNMVVIFVFVRVGGYDVFFRGWMTLIEALLLYALALLAAEGGEVCRVVVGVDPDAAWWVFGRVDEELMFVFRVEGSDPAFGKRTVFVFHAAAVG